MGARLDHRDIGGIIRALALECGERIVDVGNRGIDVEIVLERVLRGGDAETCRSIVAAGDDQLRGRGLIQDYRQALVVQQAQAVEAGIRSQLVDLSSQGVELRGQRGAGRAG